MGTTFNVVGLAILVPALVLAHLTWTKRVQETIPDPYLDEFFHVPQANAFWQGNWSHWDDKITTPPGVYLWSILYNKLYWVDPIQTEILSTRQTRNTNMFLPYALVLCVFFLERSIHRGPNRDWLSPRQLSIFAFPLIFFFSGLYYTDVFSALTVMSTYAFWHSSVSYERGMQKFLLQVLVLVSGLISLASRQTNIFWVAVFLGGLQAVHTIKQIAPLYDPSLRTAYFEDYRNFPITLIASAFSAIPELIYDLWPHVALLASFAAFVMWNGGVVLGDKSNHTATIHLAQMLYIWPFMLFFSWPVLLPYLARPDWLVRQLPRYPLIVLVVFAITAIVHFNTIVHPFLLADNRHYTFYVFKILRNQPWLWYALVPVYAISAWLIIVALDGMPEEWAAKRDMRKKGKAQQQAEIVDKVKQQGTRLSFLLIWILSMSLSLITAPLVEPRYFIVPWLIWRLHVQFPDDTLVKEPTGIQGVVVKYAVWIEIIWGMLINLITCRLFLEREFRWAQSPDEIQRFMW